MAKMYNIMIEEVEQNRVAASVTFLHPDAGQKISSKDFALQLICATACDLDWEELPVSKEEWQHSIASHPQKDKILELQDYLFGKRILIAPEEYAALADSGSKRNLERKYQNRFESWGSENGSYYVQTKMNVADFTDEAAAILLEEPQAAAIDKDSSLLTFKVHEASLLAHIKVGMSYDTAAFSIEDYFF